MRSLAFLIAATVVATGTRAHLGMATPIPATAKASFVDTAGKTIGSATLTDTPQGLKITGTVKGVAAGVHGIHVHAVGKCEGAFTTAGGHFNPTNKQHGLMNPAGPHAGDLPNITIDAKGAFSTTGAGLTLAQVLDADGAALIIHAAADDGKTDPSGNSGARVACGVIKAG